LAEALESIFHQTYPPAEVIVVNDGSTDRTAEILGSWGSRIRTVDQPHSGPSAARNAGIRLASSPYLAFLDADDLWMADKLERQLALMVGEPDMGYALTFIENFWEPCLGDVPDSLRSHAASRPRPGYYFQTMVARRWAFDQVGLLDESLPLGEDIDWFVRAMEIKLRSQVLPQTLVRRRIHGRNLTGLGGGEPDRFVEILSRSVRRRRGLAEKRTAKAP